MTAIDLDEVREFINTRIAQFHNDRVNSLSKKTLTDLIKKKNPYLLKAKNVNYASEFVLNALDAFLSSSEEKLFGDVLEDLAIFVSEKAYGGRKSIATGIDLEFTRKNNHYIVSIKSGTSWGNDSQQKAQERDFAKAVRVMGQSGLGLSVIPVLGICYGKTKSNFVRGAHKLVGQNFWYFISSNKYLYTDIVKPLGYRAKEHNERFEGMKSKVVNKFTDQFLREYCTESYEINWSKIVAFCCGNLDLDRYNM